MPVFFVSSKFDVSMSRMLHETPRILHVPASLAASSEELHEQFLSLYDHAFVVVDLTGVDTLHPALLLKLAQLRLRRRRKGLLLGRLVIDSQNVRNALTAVGFERYWLICPTREEAVRSFSGAPLYA